MDSKSGFPTLLEITTLVFIVLKLTHVINWSWWWVLSPELLETGILLCIFVCIVIRDVRSKRRKQN